MLISLNEIKKLVQIPEEISDTELIERIGSRLVEIEEVIDLIPKYQGTKIVKVASCEDIPETHLHLCQVDAGEEDLVQVVCGAPNVHAGMLAVWLAPGCIVPQTYGNENFKLGTRKLQGYESHGMLAAVDELDLGEDHAGIAEIDPKQEMIDVATGEQRFIRPGDDFAAVFGLNDLIIDVENKSLTHRPDCFGLIGFAREIAGILGQPFTEPDWLTLKPSKQGKRHEQCALEVEIQDAAICPRYTAAVFDLPAHTPSKYLTSDAIFLAKAGMRAIDPLVDLTNIMMLISGQPLHAFDYDKLLAVGGKETARITVRLAQPEEELQLLDGKTIKCIPEDILITSNNVPVALAGAMGGKNTEIDASTRRVVLESATFSLYNLRKTQMAHGIFSEAITRFTKGQPAACALPVLLESLQRLEVEPLALADQWPDQAKPAEIKLGVDEVDNLLGADYEAEEIIGTLENVGFKVNNGKKYLKKPNKNFPISLEISTSLGDGEDLRVVPPAWRTDIHIAEDVIEEVGRLLGYDNIPLDLPKKPFSGTEVAPMWALKRELRGILSDRLGMNEVLTYSFVSSNLLEKVGQDPENSYQITNSISPELQRFRQQIVPSLVDKIRENLKSGHQGFTLYELNQVSCRDFGLTAENTPVLRTDLGIATLGDFYQIKSQVLAISKRGLKLTLEYSQLTAGSPAAARYPYLEPARSAVITLDGEVIGAFGELKPAVLRRFKLDQPVSVAEIELDALVEAPRSLNLDFRMSKFPAVERDLTLKVAGDAPLGRFHGAIDDFLAGEKLIFSAEPTSIYQASQGDPTKNLSFHLKFSSPDKTLTQAEISDIMEKIAVEVVKIGAEVV